MQYQSTWSVKRRITFLLSDECHLLYNFDEKQFENFMLAKIWWVLLKWDDFGEKRAYEFFTLFWFILLKIYSWMENTFLTFATKYSLVIDDGLFMNLQKNTFSSPMRHLNFCSKNLHNANFFTNINKISKQIWIPCKKLLKMNFPLYFYKIS